MQCIFTTAEKCTATSSKPPEREKKRNQEPEKFSQPGINVENGLPDALLRKSESPWPALAPLDSIEAKQITLSVDTLNSFDPETYQSLLKSMVSRISQDVVASKNDPGISFPGETKGRCSTRVLAKDMEIVNNHSASIVSSSRKIISLEDVESPSHFSISLVDPLHFLGVVPTNRSGELLQAFIKIIVKYPFSIDGNPSPNYYNDYWVQWSMKSPLLAHLGIFTAACYQAEAQQIPPSKSATALGYKVKSIAILNEMLVNKEMSTSNEAITGVVYLIINEWYWSCYENIQAHFAGLREMVRLRGGLGEMGMHDFLRKMIIMVDYYVSCSHNCDPSFPHNVQAGSSISDHVNSPLLYSDVKYITIATKLRIGIETATILDDMRFLLQAVIKQVNRAPADIERLKLARTSIWIRDRIIDLPVETSKDHPLSSDFLYKSCRVAALIYCKAIVEHIPLSQACTIHDLNHLWASMWRINLTRWKEIPGIFLFIILSANQAAQNTPHGRFLKSMLKASSSFMALDDWHAVDGIFMGFLKLQRWLGEQSLKEETSTDPGRMEFMHIYQQ